MKVLVCPHDLVIGGCQINAIDLAAAVAEQGHEVVVYGVPGPLNEYIDGKGLRFVPAHPLKYRPAPTRVWQLLQLARRERFDLIHAYEWPPCLDAYFGAHLVARVPLVCTVLSMSLVPLIPASLRLVMGTRDLADHARRERGGRVELIEPPVDTDRDAPSFDGGDFRRRHGIGGDEVLFVVVSRLAVDMKLDSLVRAIDAVGDLARRLPVRLVMVGTGDAVAELSGRAERVNSSLGRPVIELPGPALDPRAAYAAADVVVGMGSSALRGMAFAKPVVVQGEAGFSAIFEPSSCEEFYRVGLFGIGDGRQGCELLAAQMESLVTGPRRRQELGKFGRDVVVERYSLSAASAALLKIYEDAVSARTAGRHELLGEAARVGFRAIANEGRLHLPSDKRARRSKDAAKLAMAGKG